MGVTVHVLECVRDTSASSASAIPDAKLAFVRGNDKLLRMILDATDEDIRNVFYRCDRPFSLWGIKSLAFKLASYS